MSNRAAFARISSHDGVDSFWKKGNLIKVTPFFKLLSVSNDSTPASKKTILKQKELNTTSYDQNLLVKTPIQPTA